MNFSDTYLKNDWYYSKCQICFFLKTQTYATLPTKSNVRQQADNYLHHGCHKFAWFILLTCVGRKWSTSDFLSINTAQVCACFWLFPLIICALTNPSWWQTIACMRVQIRSSLPHERCDRLCRFFFFLIVCLHQEILFSSVIDIHFWELVVNFHQLTSLELKQLIKNFSLAASN